MAKITSPKNLKNISIDEILQGLTENDTQKTLNALDFAAKVYGDKALPMGELIIEHTTGVAKQVANLGMDGDCRCAALLSRVITVDNKLAEVIEKDFGENTLRLVRGLEKLRRIDLSGFMRPESETSENKNRNSTKNSAIQAEALRKMLLVLTDDIRIIVLKLVGRIQTLHYIYKHPSDSARQIAQSSLNYLAPLANRLSIHELKWPIEDWAFRILEPQKYKELAKSLQSKREDREKFVEYVLSQITQIVKKTEIKVEIKGRAKHLYSIYKKTLKKSIPISQLFDLNATRILVDSVEDCYLVLDLIHSRWQFIQSEFDDYIARPKANGYKSLHTVVLIEGKAVEVQIRTFEMHRLAESGLASHWRYKEGVKNDNNFEARLTLLRELMDWQKDIAGSDVRLQSLAEDTIYCLTPLGDVFDLPQGATPIDFAYRVHTDLGHRCRGAKIDGHLLPLSTTLKSGQCVDIVTVKEGGPSQDWLREDLGYIKSSRAKAKVRAWFNSIKQEEKINEGKSIWLRMQNRLRPAGKPSPSGEEISGKLNFHSLEDFYLALAKADIGMHHLKALVRGLDNESSPVVKAEKNKKSTKKTPANVEDEYSDKVIILDLEGVLYQKAICCKPTPPSTIIGYITRNSVVSVHCADCREFRFISNRMPERVVAVAWRKNKKNENQVVELGDQKLITLNINIIGKQPQKYDGNLLAEVMGYVNEHNIKIDLMNFNIAENKIPTVYLSIKTNNAKGIINALKKLSLVDIVEIIKE